MNMAVQRRGFGVTQLRIMAIESLKVWREQMRAAEVHSQHPLDTVRQLPPDKRRSPAQLLMGGRVYGKETRPSSRSRPLVRDMSPHAEEVNRWLRFIRDEINPRYARALELWTETGSHEAVAKQMRIDRRTATQYFECGLVAIQVKMSGS